MPLFLLIVFSLFSFLSYADPCSLYYLLVSKPGWQTPESHLALFDPSRIQKSVDLGNPLKLTLDDGREYIIRFESSSKDAAFEAFAASFLRSAPHCETPLIRQISGKVLQDTIGKIEMSARYSKIKIHKASLATFYPDMQTGKDYLDELTKKAGGMKSPENIPAEVLTQIADLWAIYTVLGIPDFHAKNWLIHNRHVLGIDLEGKSDDFNDGKITLALEYQQNPFDIHKADNWRAFLKEKISPEMRNFLTHLQPARLQELGKEQNFPLSLS